MSAGDFPNLKWQHEYNRNWISYSYDEMCVINKAVQRNQKTVSLPSNDPRKKIVINLEKMSQKNLVSGFEQLIRCLIYYDSHACWSWKDDYDEWVYYLPRTAFLLEVAFQKRMEKVNITIRDDYEVNIQQFIQVNKETQYKRSVSREIIKFKALNENAHNNILMMKDDILCRDFMNKAEIDFSRYQIALFNVPASVGESSKSSAGSSTSEFPAVPERIISALNAAAQSSTSAQQDTTATVAVDPDCPKASKYGVYCESGDFYNATLNFANLQDNNNKYFIIQLLKHNSKKQFAVWFHWGRVGYKGQSNLVNCGTNLEEAKSTFEQKFYDKTRNQWSERNNFRRVSSKYDLVHVELTPEVSKISRPRPSISAETKLDIRLQSLLQIICSKKKMEEAAKEMSYDSNKTPLGKMTAKQIREGYDALKQISDIIKLKGKCKELVEANNVFYTKIPHDFGRKSPPLLDKLEDVKEKLKMLEDLSNICLAMDVLSSTADGPENIIDKYYRTLECDLVPLEPESDEFKALCKCLLETHGPTHKNYTMELVDAFKCVKQAQESSFLDLGNKKLLWHGSRISNWLGILKKGLQIAPPEAPSTGYMFGKGIYFADIGSKSANYCYATKNRNEGLLLLSEVSLGNAFPVVEANDYSYLSEGGYHSVFGVGKMQPSKFEKTVLSTEASVAHGPLNVNENEDLELLYNEYVIYNVQQVKMKYLLRIRFNF